MDTSKLSVDDLVRVSEVIPTDAEKKALKSIKLEQLDDLELHDAEKTLFTLTLITKLAEKVP